MNYKDYFLNNKFSNCLSYKIDSNLVKQNRIEFIKQQVKNKTVLHFGFVDHSLNLSHNKKWLHGELLSSAKEVYGVDILKKEVEFYKKKYPHLFCFNILADPVPNEIKNKSFDVVVLGEILEHIPEPIIFLKKINSCLNFKKIIITVPNAFAINNFFNVFKGAEKINSDHYFWFTPYTLSKQLYLSKFVIEKMVFSDHKYKFNFIFNILKKNGFFNSTIIVIARKSNKTT